MFFFSIVKKLIFFIVNSDDIKWDDKTKTATVIVKREEKIKKEHETD